MYELIGEADREHFVALYLNARNTITHAHIVSRGTAQSALVHPREVFKGAVLANSSAVIVGHNHPSNDVNPSGEDQALFERLKSAGEIMGIRVLDSVIVGSGSDFYCASVDAVISFARAAGPILPPFEGASRGGTSAAVVAQLTTICGALLDNIDEAIERQGEAWWKENVSAGLEHRKRAETALGRSPYPDEPSPPPKPS